MTRHRLVNPRGMKRTVGIFRAASAVPKVRYSLAIAVLSTIVAASCHRETPDTSSCESLDARGRIAMALIIDNWYPMSDDPIIDPNDDRVALAELAKEKGPAVRCLVDVYRNGPIAFRPWTAKRPVPRQGHGVMWTIERLSPETALALHREERQSTTPGTAGRLWVDTSMARLGDMSVLEEMTDLLLHPERMPEDEREKADSARTRSLEVLVERRYRPALRVLEKEQRARPGDTMLTLLVAELKGDVVGLERLAHGRGTADRALEALWRIGRRDIVERLARDPTYSSRATAGSIIQRRARS